MGINDEGTGGWTRWWTEVRTLSGRLIADEAGMSTVEYPNVCVYTRGLLRERRARVLHPVVRNGKLGVLRRPPPWIITKRAVAE